MPLRDHFHTHSTVLKWEALHSFWPAAIVARLNSILPKEYIAQPRVRLGTMMEIDVGALERESGDLPPGPSWRGRRRCRRRMGTSGASGPA